MGEAPTLGSVQRAAAGLGTVWILEEKLYRLHSKHTEAGCLPPEHQELSKEGSGLQGHAGRLGLPVPGAWADRG